MEKEKAQCEVFQKGGCGEFCVDTEDGEVGVEIRGRWKIATLLLIKGRESHSQYFKGVLLGASGLSDC